MSEAPRYHSHALTEYEWLQQSSYLLTHGWEWLHRKSEGVVYIRKHISGPVNTDSGWQRYAPTTPQSDVAS